MDKKDFDKAFDAAKKRYDRTDPTERYSFEKYLTDQIQSDRARKYPGEYHDPLAD
jgi:hypothetical protein